MGLAVAYQLARDGHVPVVYEAADRIGGMTATFDFGGLTTERYYHFHCTSDSAFFQLLDELKLSDRMHWVSTKMGYWYQNQLQSWGTPLALLKFQGLGMVAKFRYGLHAFLSTKRDHWQDLDPIEATGWIKRWVGPEAYEVLWRRLFDFKFYHYSENLSAAWIWSRIRRVGRSRYSIFREKLGYMEGGSDTFLQALKRDIEAHGGEFRLSSPVARVTSSQGKVTGIQSNDLHETFDTVISTVPMPYVAPMVPDLPSNVLDQYRSLKNIAVVCVIAKLKKQVTENFWLNTNDPDMDIPGLIEYSNLRPTGTHLVYVPFYMPGERPEFKEPDEAYAAKVRKYVSKINPGISESDFIDVKVSRYRFAQPICEPGHLSKLPPIKTAIAGLYIADTSYYYPEDRGISESIAFGRQLAKDACSA